MLQKRVALWDNVKLLLMLTVVTGHFVQPYVETSYVYKFIFLLICTFHMPLFIFLSGLFYKEKDIKEKIMGYLAIYLVFQIAIFLLRVCSGKGYSFSLFSTSAVPWFMFAIAVYIGITYCLRGINKRFLLLFFFALGCFSGYDKSIGDYLILSRIFVFYPWFLLGTCLSRENLEKIARNRWVKIVSILFLAAAAVFFYVNLDRLYFLRPLLTGRNPFNDRIAPRGCLLRLACYFLSGTIGFAAMMALPFGKIPLITSAGSKSLQIYFWHYFVLQALAIAGVGSFLFSCGAWGKATWLLCGIAVTFLCACPLFSFPTAGLMRAPYLEKRIIKSGEQGAAETEKQEN